MKEPIWIPAEVILAVQGDLLARFEGPEGLRDEGLLDSVLNRPQHLVHSDSPTLFDLASEYALGIVKNHPFLDGNKRAGFMAAYIFLGANGQDLEASEADAVVQTRALAAGEIDQKEYAVWLKASCDN